MSEDELKARARQADCYTLESQRGFRLGALSERERWEKERGWFQETVTNAEDEIAKLRERVAALENVVTWVRKQMCFCSEDDHPEHFMDGECKIYPHAEYKKALAALDATGRSGG